MKAFHFSFGDSSNGPIGFCARIVAEDEAQAVAKLKEHVGGGEWGEKVLWDAGLSYGAVYFNFDKVSVADIDEEEELEHGR